jgi:hypothetical protein
MVASGIGHHLRLKVDAIVLIAIVLEECGQSSIILFAKWIRYIWRLSRDL